MRFAANKYRIIQVGLGLFIKKEEKQYEVRSYNIYVFPKECYGCSPQINMDVSAVNFNTDHNMDWNTWIKEGFSFLVFNIIFFLLKNFHLEAFNFYKFYI